VSHTDAKLKNQQEYACILWLCIRDLYDDESNSLEDYDKKIDLAWELIQKHGRVVICCVAGISRGKEMQR